MQFVYNDGGRAKAGFKGKTGDCVIRAICIATGADYGDLYREVRKRMGTGHSPRAGVPKPLIKKIMAERGWKWTPCMGIGTGTKVHLDPGELPSGPLVVSCSRHLVAVIDGVVHDTYDCTRENKRAVYGYWSKQ